MTDLSDKIHAANEHLVEKGEASGLAACFSPDYIAHIGDTTRTGHSVVRRFTDQLLKSFSGLTVRVQVLMETEDRIAWQRTMSGVQTGSIQGFPASNAKVTWHDNVISRFENGLIAEEWVVTDLAEALLRSRKH